MVCLDLALWVNISDDVRSKKLHLFKHLIEQKSGGLSIPKGHCSEFNVICFSVICCWFKVTLESAENKDLMFIVHVIVFS